MRVSSGGKEMDVKTLANMPPFDWPEGADEVMLEV